jgi:hypothetical protein
MNSNESADCDKALKPSAVRMRRTSARSTLQPSRSSSRPILSGTFFCAGGWTEMSTRMSSGAPPASSAISAAALCEAHSTPSKLTPRSKR